MQSKQQGHLHGAINFHRAIFSSGPHQTCLNFGSFRVWIRAIFPSVVLAFSRTWKLLWDIVLPSSPSEIENTIICPLVWKVCHSMSQITGILKFSLMYLHHVMSYFLEALCLTEASHLLATSCSFMPVSMMSL